TCVNCSRDFQPRAPRPSSYPWPRFAPPKPDNTRVGFVGRLRDYRLSQQFITPYTPEQNGIIERFFRSLKEECAWQYNFASFLEAKMAIAQWIEWYNAGRSHQSLGYKSPREYRAQERTAVA
ncbi:MAG: integrase core domain-containing protein, partial [Spirochaetia bacterium]